MKQTSEVKHLHLSLQAVSELGNESKTTVADDRVSSLYVIPKN